MSDPLSDRAPPARPGVSSSDSDPECPDSERRFAAGHVRLGRWPLPRIPSGVTCFAFSRQAYCGRAGPSLYQLHLVHTRKGSSPLRGHSHPCCCRSVIFSRSSKVLLSRIYSTNASLRERLAAPVLGFSRNSVPIFYCACWIAVGLATLSAFLSVLHLCRPATLPVDFSCYNFSSTLLRCPTNSSHSPNCLPHFASASLAARLFFSLFHLLEFPLHSVLVSLLAPVG